MSFKDKKIILTGAGSGLGKELTIQLLMLGAQVIAIDKNKENLEILKNEVNNDRLYIYELDITDDDKLDEFKKEYMTIHKVVDVLINNAGIIQPFVNVNELDMSVINKIMNVNFFSALKLTKLFLNELLERKEAHIVNISSMGGFFPFPKQSVYGASKAALKLFTEGLYAELMDTNVHVTLILPGAMSTDIAKNSGVEIKQTSSDGEYNAMPVDKAARIIIKGIEKNRFKVYVGSDSKFMNFLYKLNDEKAIKFMKKKMEKYMS